MKLKFPALLLVAVALAMVLAGCSSGNVGGPGMGGGDHMGGGNHMGGGGGASGKELTDVPAGAAKLDVAAKEFSFAPNGIDAKAGPATITLSNKGTVIHDLSVDAPGIHVAAQPGQTASASYNLTPGTYEFYCTIPGHKAAGMKGTLTVT